MKQFTSYFQIKYAIKFAMFLILALQTSFGLAQNKRIIRKANNSFIFSKFNKALPLYLHLLKNEPNNFLYNYRVGMCYLNSNVETNRSLGYLETARSNFRLAKDSTPDFYYFLGHAYQVRNQFDNALKFLTHSKNMLDGKKDSLNIYFINQEIEQCENGLKLISLPTSARLFNLGGNVNTIYPDYSPLVTSDWSTLVFTSTRLGSTGGKISEQVDFYEDIYTSKYLVKDSVNLGSIQTQFYEPDFMGGTFTKANNAGKLVNTKYHDATISITPNGKKLYLYRNNNVWQADLKNGKIGKPYKYDYVVGEKKRSESSLATTLDEKTLYFVSDQTGGIGGKDIYKSIKQLDGTWGAAENLGSIVNTDLDEESPFFDSKNGILYFSSQGHNSMGGFDVYKTKFDNDVWIKPQNMGYPINSGTDDVFYSFDSEQNKGVMSTMRDNAVGNYDIYLIRNIKPLQVLFATTFSNNLKPIEEKIEILNSKGEKNSSLNSNTISVINCNSAEKFKMRIPHYDSLNVFNEFEFETPESFGDYSYYQEVNYDVVKNPKGQLIGYKTTLYNAFFDIEKEVKKEIELSKMVNKQLAYSAFVKSLISENIYFQIFSKINYIDTSNYLIQEEEMAARALAAGVPDENYFATKDKGNEVAKDIVTKKEQVVVSRSAAFKTILFHFSKMSLSTEANVEVKNIAEYLKENKDVKMEIIGYTDSKGKSKFNRELSKKRADVIKGMLVKKGISASRLKTKGLGEKNPVTANKNEDNSDNLEGRKLNRRVEFVIVAGK